MSDASPELFIGLMSGTSMDGIDAALVCFENNRVSLLNSHTLAFSAAQRDAIDALCTGGTGEIDSLGQLDVQLGQLFADATLGLLEKAGKSPQDISAIGSHGQTIRHRPALQHPFSMQIADPNVIAYKTGITVVADFRRRDIAASGQGAPLVPAFHREIFHSHQINRAVLNLGGIANLTLLPKEGDPVLGFDTGPGNGLMNVWCETHQGRPFDEGGSWARTGTVHEALLHAMSEDPYFSLPPPKSTGRDYFNMPWLEGKLRTLPDEQESADSADVAATLLELTATSIVRALQDYYPQCDDVIVCGGGVHNHYLISRIKANLNTTAVQPSSALGIDPDWVEAIAFAWLAKQTLERKPGNLPSVTGADQSCILGGVYFT